MALQVKEMQEQLEEVLALQEHQVAVVELEELEHKELMEELEVLVV